MSATWSNDESHKKNVRDFLIEVKQTIMKPSGNYQSWFIAKREENINSIAQRIKATAKANFCRSFSYPYTRYALMFPGGLRL